MTHLAPQDADAFDAHRSLLFAIAYRMVGSVMDAEDIVQEAYLDWQRRDDRVVVSPKGYLSTVVTRRSIDHLRSARVQRETYTGPWLPEPIVTEREPDLDDTAMLHESLSMAFLVLLESLTPDERAIFLLHDVFAYDFHEIAGIVGKSEANCRQIARRARQQIQARRPRFDPSPEHHAQLTQQFIAACLNGDLSALLDTLAEDATFWGDSGGKVPQAAPRPIVGAQRVAAFILGFLRKAPTTFRAERTVVNGQPGFIFSADNGVTGVVALDIVDARIQAIRIVVNPDKLHGVAAVPNHPRSP
jgi:RNA polymerase sigma-70 factor (ECF subfamily)